MLAWLPSLILILIDLFVGLSQAKANPNNRSFQGPQPTALKKVKTIIFIFFLAFMCFILKAANRVHVRSEPILCRSTNVSPLPIRQSTSHEPREAFYEVSLCQRFSRLNLEFFSRMFNDIYWKLPAADGQSSHRCHATRDMWNESRGLFVTKWNVH